jgi:ubiquinone/menaquinone biosynthesis C-methylase UbiE
MQFIEAVTLIRTDRIKSDQPQIWADLGCGSGLFTRALAGILYAQSTIYAVDKNMSFFKTTPISDKINISPLESDFVTDQLDIRNLDGILMANAFHFVRDKKAFLEKIKSYFKDQPLFLIVEYDLDSPNRWVPYPMNFISLNNFFTSAGFHSIIKISERPSIYHRADIYAAVIC